MFRDVFLAQFWFTLRRPLLYLFCAFMAFSSYDFSSNIDPRHTNIIPIGDLWHNSPYLIARYLLFMGIFGFLFITVLVGPAVVQDFKHRCHEFFFTTPIGKTRYLAGRFLGAFSASLTIYAALIVGFLVGCTTLSADRLGPFYVSAWLAPILILLLPNLLLIAVVFFSVGTLTRNMVATYVLSIAVMVAYGLTQKLTPGDSNLATLLDPFGLVAFDAATQFWTVSERNLQGIPWTGWLLANRLLWLSITATAAILVLRRFRFHSDLDRGKVVAGTLKDPGTGSKEVRRFSRLVYPAAHLNGWSPLSRLLRLAAFDVRRVALHPGFIIILAMGLAQLSRNLSGNLGANGSFIHPLTGYMLTIAPRHISLYTLAFTLFFAGVIVWRERDHRTDSFFDSLPVPNWVFFGAKLLAVLALQTLYMLTAVLTCIVIQIVFHGYTRLELDLYLTGFFGIELVTLWFFGVAAVLIQTLSPNKYWGFALTAGLFISDGILLNFGITENLFRFGTNSGYIYSDLNGFGHFLTPLLWHQAYWLCLCGLLAVIGTVFWPRGLSARTPKQRSGPGDRLLALGMVLGFLGIGLWIYYNTHILNTYCDSDFLNALRAQYESRYKSFEGMPRAHLRHVDLDVEIYPRQRDAVIRGIYTLRNDTELPVEDTLFTIFPFRNPNLLRLEARSDEGTVQIEEDLELGVRRLRFSPPLPVGREIALEFEVEFRNRGFAATNLNNEIVANGSYVDGLRAGWYFPIIGYERHLELSAEELRASFGLEPQTPLPDPGAAEARSRPVQGGDKVTFDMTVTTDEDQIPLGPGELVRSWTEGGRSSARFRSQTPVSFGGICFYSGRYEVLQEQHQGVKIDIYSHPNHGYNLESMVQGVRRALDYGNLNYGSYPYPNLRIVEVPDLGTIGGTARSLPGVFAWTETGGFVSDLTRPGTLDVVYNTTTHETAHQWWGHLLTPGESKGAGVLAETLTQWVRIATLKQEYGPQVAQEFRRDEMRRYLRSRGLAGDELPLGISDSPSLLYRKGTMVMSALGEGLGEETLNRALRNLFEGFSFQPSFPTTTDLIDQLRNVASPDQQTLITDLFEMITLFDNRIVEVEPVRREGDRYRVAFTVQVRKLRADSQGKENQIASNDWIEVAARDQNEEIIHLERVLFREEIRRIEFLLDQAAAWVEIDPRVLIIDRNLSDNRAGLENPKSETPNPK